MDEEPWRPLVQNIGEGAADWLDARRVLGQRAVDHAVLSDDARQKQLRDRLDDSRAADAGDTQAHRRIGEARVAGPEVAADHLEARLQRFPVDPDPFDRAGSRALAAGNLRALEGR